MSLRAPFPYMGGKSRVAEQVWQRLGNTPNYVEPFFGSGAVLLGRPDEHQWWQQTETVNDADGLLANLWRSIQREPEAVARHANWPVSECDLHARHSWLNGQRENITRRLEGDPDWCDPKAAGWWVWGACCWIGGGWCANQGPWRVVDGELLNVGGGVKRQLPHLGNDGVGIHRKLPHLGNDGVGIHRQLPHLGNDGRGHCEAWGNHLAAMMQALSDRLRRVRVCCGDWTRVCGPTPTEKHGVTAVFLDPPYSHAERDATCYAHEMDCADAVREWAVAHGDNPLYRIALCGYGGEHDLPDSWDCVAWKAHGGYGNQGTGRGRDNATRERIWYSPHCLQPQQAILFDFDATEVAE